MNDIIETIASEITKRGQYINFQHNSIFDMIESFGNNEADYSLVANKLSNGLINEINKIRNIYRPFKNDYKNKVSEFISKTEVVSKAKDYEIISIELPQVFRELKTRKMLDDSTTKKELLTDTLILKQPENIKSLINFDNEVINRVAKPIINKYSEKDLTDIWNKYFINISNSNSNFNLIAMNPEFKVDDYVILYGIINTLRKEKMLVNSAVQDSKYFNIINMVFNNIKFAINSFIKLYQSVVKVKKLIYKVNDKKIYVYEDVYEEFLNGDNKSEVLLGMCVKFGNTITYDATMLADVLIHKDIYLNTWNNYINVERVANSYKEVNRHKLAYETALVELVRDDVTDDIYNDITIEPNDVHKALSKLLPKYKDSELLDVEFMCNEIIGKLVIANTNYYKFVTVMVEISNLNPDLKPEEAATLAGIELIVDYVVEQLTTDKLDGSY